MNERLQIKLCGETSFDIYPRGWDKTFALQHFEDYQDGIKDYEKAIEVDSNDSSPLVWYRSNFFYTHHNFFDGFLWNSYSLLFN